MTRRLRVTLIDPLSGGHHAFYASQAIRALNDMGAVVFYVGSDLIHFNGTERLDRTSIVSMNGHSQKQRFLFAERSIRLAKEFKTDLVHLLFLDHFVLPYWIQLVRLQSLPVLASLHWGYLLQELSRRRTKDYIERMALKRLAQANFTVFVHSKTLRERLIEEGLGHVIYLPYPVEQNRVDPKAFKALRGHAREKLGIGNGDVLLLCFGGTRNDKGADLAVRALKHLPDNYHLLIAGPVVDFSLETLLQNSENKDRSRLHLDLRYIPDDEIPTVFSAADIALLPYRKGFAGQSGPLTMAGAYGIPVVGSSNVVIRETIENCGIGECFSPESVDNMVEQIVVVSKNLDSYVRPQEVIEQLGSARFREILQDHYSGGRFV